MLHYVVLFMQGYIEDGGIYRHLGIKNFLEGDLFSWYLDAWNDDLEKIIRQMVAVLDEYDPKTLSIDPIESRDLLKKLYQQLFPKTVRHDLGEYYTPDWLAEIVIERVGYDGEPNKRVLDPACGSGTFLVMAINKVREFADKHMIPKHELLPKILNNIVGFDLNPLAVMAARTNYLLALRELLKLGGEIEIPVYLCDSIMTPAEYGELLTKEGTATGGIGQVQELKTSAARFMIPTEIAQSRQTVAKYTEELEHCVRNDYTEDEFISRLKGERIPSEAGELHKALYRQVVTLKQRNQNDIWARIIKNSFAPLFIERVDYVLGNPPWVFWNNLPPEYREQVRHLMVDTYEIAARSASTMKRLGSAGKDISALFVYVCLDRYLTVRGRLGFVITQTLFQSTAADEFRQFRLPGGVPFCIAGVDDWVKVAPFVAAANKTTTFVAIKGEENRYPVAYRIWEVIGKFDRETALIEEVKENIRCREAWGWPSDPKRATSFWLIGESQKRRTPTSGEKHHYEVRRGVETGLESAFRVRVLQYDGGDTALVENIIECAYSVCSERYNSVFGKSGHVMRRTLPVGVFGVKRISML